VAELLTGTGSADEKEEEQPEEEIATPESLLANLDLESFSDSNLGLLFQITELTKTQCW
jgi:hypothetical protein